MSASDKKKLRKEQQSAALTEKQRAEQKQQKKNKITTATFITVMVLVVVTVIVAVLQTPVTNVLMRSTDAMSVNDHTITAVEFNYFYKDYISNFYNQFSDYGTTYQDIYVQLYTGLNPTASLGSQVFDKETGETWADYFMDMGMQSAEWTYAMYDAAVKADHKLTESEQSSLDSTETYLEYYAAYYGYSNAKTYLKALYGGSATVETYIEYLSTCTMANSYASAYLNGLEFTEEQYREYEAGKENEYNSYSYAYYYINANNYLQGGTTTKDEDGKETTTYSDEEKQAARDAALVDAKLLAESGFKTVEELNEAIKNLSVNAEKETPPTATQSNAVLYSSLPTVEGMADFISDPENADGTITYLVYKTHTHADGSEHKEDEENSEQHDVINGYYVVLKLETIENTMSIGSVRHLLVMFKNADGKTYSDGIKEFTDEQKATAYNTASDILKEYKSGEMTETKFSDLVKKHSEDTGSKSTGGLISDITPDSGYVKNFAAWATAEHEVGDVEIIETEYGYHIMYYVEKADLNYRDTLIDTAMREEEYNGWQEDLLEETNTVKLDMKYLDDNYVISQ